MSTAGVLTLCDRGGDNPVTVEAWGVRLSWAINTAGQLSAFIGADTARQFGAQGANWCGTKWAYMAHPDLPRWGGVITRPRWTRGIFEVGAEDFLVLMRARIVSRVYEQQAAPAGALANRAFADVQSDDSMLVVSFAADEEGAVAPISGRGGDLLDNHFRQLAQMSGQEFSCDADRNVEWRIRLGEFKPDLMLTSGDGCITDYDYSGDLWTTRNTIEGVATDARQDRSATETLEHTDSVRAIGRHEASVRYPEAVSRSTLRPLILRDLRAQAWPAETMALTVRNLGRVWSQIRLGDSFFVKLVEPNVTRLVRVFAISVDIDNQEMRLGVEVTGEADGWG